MRTKIRVMFKKLKLSVVLSFFLFGCGFLLSGGIANAASCTGTVPDHAEMYFGDDMMLTVDMPFVYSTLNNWDKKCEFTCNTGYIWTGSACVLPAPRCTGTVPQHAEMYFQDDMELTVNTPFVYSSSNNLDKKCEFTCSSGYNWNGYACAALSYSCTGTLPAHAEIYSQDDMMLTVNTPLVYSSLNNWDKKCEFYCSSGYKWNGYACGSPTPTPRCTGTIPQDATMYFGDDMMLTVDMPFVYSTLNNWDKKCEFTCNTGYIWTGSACVLPAPRCTGTVPQHAEMYFQDDMELTVNTPFVYSSSNNLDKKCEFTCSSGYNWNGYACAALSYSCTGTLPAHAEIYSQDNMMLTVDTPLVYSSLNNLDKKCEFYCSSGYNWNGETCVL